INSFDRTKDRATVTISIVEVPSFMKHRLLQFGSFVAVSAVLLLVPAQAWAAGYTWTSRTTPGLKSWTSIASSADGKKLAAVERNSDTVWTSSDAGATWTSHSSGSLGFEYITSSADGTHLVAMEETNPGDLWTSSDSGVTWTNRSTAGAETWVK